MKKSILFGALALTASVFADGDVDMIAAQRKSDMQMKDQNMMEQQKKPMPVTLTSARPETENGWYLFADALYWHADVGSTEWAWKVNDTNATVPTGDLHSLRFKWSWGFRVGVGANIDHDKWDTNVYFTWLRSENSNKAGVGPSGVVHNIAGSFNEENNALFTTGKSKWNIRFNMFDWELGRWYYVSKNLALRPHVGVKGGWIHQHTRYHFTDASTNGEGVTGNIQAKNNFWGVGPCGGINTQWILGFAGDRMDHRFNLFGDFAGALMYGHFDVTHSERSFSGETLINGHHPKNLDFNLAVPVLQAMLGLSWDTGFNDNLDHFTLRVGYEFQYWFRQNQQVRPVNNGYHRISDDLALQGLTLDFRFDF